MKKIMFILILSIFLCGCSNSSNEKEINVIKTDEKDINVIKTYEEQNKIYTKDAVKIYAISISIAIADYKLNHNGEYPKEYCDIEPYFAYESNVVCKVTILNEYEFALEHCKVGNNKDASYKYLHSKDVKDSEVEEEEETIFADKTICN